MKCTHCYGTIREFELDVDLAECDPDATPAKQIGPNEYIHLGCLEEVEQGEIITNADQADPQAKAQENIARIESVIVKLCDALLQEKADIGTAGWTTANELAHVAARLEEVHAFWTQSGEEYESRPEEDHLCLAHLIARGALPREATHEQAEAFWREHGAYCPECPHFDTCPCSEE